MKQIIMAVLVLMAMPEANAQLAKPVAAPAPKPKTVISEMIVKGYVAVPAGKATERGRMIRITVNRMDNRGRLAETMSSTGADTVGGIPVAHLAERRLYKYDKKGALLTTLNLRTDGSIIDSVMHKPGDKPVVPDWYNYQSTGKPMKKAAYTYDAEHNWVRMVTYDNGKPARIIERVISYY